MLTHGVFRSGLLRRGFTLIELLVVVAIIALLISILLPALSSARNGAKDALCMSNLRQLAMAITYYADDNDSRLPYIKGTPDSSDPPIERSPYWQYHQIFQLWRYIKSNKDLKIYRCPRAVGENSVKSLDLNEGSHYTVSKQDVLYRRIALPQGWWPDINPNDYPGDWITPLYTEYYFNDWGNGATDPATGQKIPQVSGGPIAKFPRPAYTVTLADARWELERPPKISPPPRHGTKGDSNHFAFLDAHVEKLPKWRFITWKEDLTPKDCDAYGNQPFYAWGLSRDNPVDGRP